MRIALYDASNLQALTTIEFPDAVLHDPKPARWEVNLLPQSHMQAVILIDAIMVYMPAPDTCSGLVKVYVGTVRNMASLSWLRFAFFRDEATPELVPVQHIPFAQKQIRQALGMGDAR